MVTGGGVGGSPQKYTWRTQFALLLVHSKMVQARSTFSFFPPHYIWIFFFHRNCPSVVVVRTRRNLCHCSERGVYRAGCKYRSEVALCIFGRECVCVHILCRQRSQAVKCIIRRESSPNSGVPSCQTIHYACLPQRCLLLEEFFFFIFSLLSIFLSLALLEMRFRVHAWQAPFG